MAAYSQSPTTCKACLSPLPFNARANLYCGRACAARTNNAKRDTTKLKATWAEKLKDHVHTRPKNHIKKTRKPRKELTEKVPRIKKAPVLPKHRLDKDEYGNIQRVYDCVCAASGIKFVAIGHPRKYHPDFYEDRLHYKNLCSFRFWFPAFPEWFADGVKLLTEHGMYVAETKSKKHRPNPRGVSRDHMISIAYGFKNSIDPALLAHPANCAIMRHNQNQKKSAQCSISLEELKLRIWAFEWMYPNYRSVGAPREN